jgi:hypothetical protein
LPLVPLFAVGGIILSLILIIIGVKKR